MPDNIMYKEVEVNGVANEETVENILTGTEEEQYYIISISYTETTSTLQGDATLRAYVEREKIVDMSYQHLLDYSGSNSRWLGGWIEINRKLNTGETLKVGFVSGSTASNFKIAIKYYVVS